MLYPSVGSGMANEARLEMPNALARLCQTGRESVNSILRIAPLLFQKGSQFFIRVRDKPFSVAVSVSNPDSSHAGKKC